eukprot:365846-Chlamydomonas_euryale.AAC.7
MQHVTCAEDRAVRHDAMHAYMHACMHGYIQFVSTRWECRSCCHRTRPNSAAASHVMPRHAKAIQGGMQSHRPVAGTS